MKPINRIENDENYSDRNDKILPAVSVSFKDKPKCPYFPTCSEYGLGAVEKYGALKGGLLAVWRILRCNPFSKGGYDPSPRKPESKSRRKYH